MQLDHIFIFLCFYFDNKIHGVKVSFSSFHLIIFFYLSNIHRLWGQGDQLQLDDGSMQIWWEMGNFYEKILQEDMLILPEMKHISWISFIASTFHIIDRPQTLLLVLTIKHLGWGGMSFSKEKMKPCFFATFNIIIRHIFLENFIEVPQVVRKTWRIFLSILANFIDFHRFFGLFLVSLVQRN